MFDLSHFALGDFLIFIAIGFTAQLVDGALGMAFGVISTTLLITMGSPPMHPAAASAAVPSRRSRPAFPESAMRLTATSTGACSPGW